MEAQLERLSREKYVLLTTFRKSGEPVPTPVWAARDGDELVLFSVRTAGKVKRIRRNPRVELTACDLRGHRTHGETVSGLARILDDADSDRVRRVLARKYGLTGRVTMFFSRLRGGPQRTVGIAIGLGT
ncbi:PPOX class F420-dependent oxidoreductase [Saccharomonospora sp. NPDC046836]|uniref:PPOX class F420-dependent oxidoreductase n=1 Tax=Saccharomonospora sp. NPDC046836 TaxID=3156921 RepID=UPI0033D05185